MTSPIRPRFDRGLSLTELLVALSIAAILGLVALPSLGDLATNSRMVTQANALLAALHQTRSRALTRNEPWTLCLTDDGRRCKTGRAGFARGWRMVPLAETDQEDPDSTAIAGLVGVTSALMPPDLVLHGSRFQMTFWPYSRSGTTSTLTLCSASPSASGRSRQIVISQTGRPRLKILSPHIPCPA